MKKIKAAFLLLVTLSIAYDIPAHALAKEIHNDYMARVLFGSKSSVSNPARIKLLENASYLAIDQYNNRASDAGMLNALKEHRIYGLPGSIGEINFSGNAHHREHTHKGWDYTGYKGYENDNDIAHWKIRKNILLATVDKVFKFRVISGTWFGSFFNYDEKCNSLSALIYYTHILGDYTKDDGDKNTKDKIPLFVKDPSDKAGLILMDELQRYLEILFKGQQDSRNYTDMMRELDVIKSDAALDSAHSVSSSVSAKMILKILEDNIPILLKKEEYFHKVFYSTME